MGAQVSRRGRRGGRRHMSEINVTPFVDVMLVLLIVFMVAAPLLTVGVPVNLPETRAEQLPSAEREPVTINVAIDGRIFLQGTEVAFDDLSTQLAAIESERGAADRVYVRGDTNIDYGRVMQVMGELTASGFRNIALVTDPSSASPLGEGG